MTSTPEAPSILGRPGLPRVPAPLAVAAVAVLGAAVGALIGFNLVLGLALLIGLLFVPLALVRLDLAVIAWIPLLYLQGVPAIGRGATLAVALLLVAWIGALLAQRSELRRTVRDLSIPIGLTALLIAWLAASAAWSLDPDATFEMVREWIFALVAWLLVATAVVTRRGAVAVLVALVVGALASVALGLPSLRSASLLTVEASRLGGTFQDPNFLASGAIGGFVLAVALASITRHLWLRSLFGFGAAILLIGAAATGSRGGVIAFLVAVVVALVVMRRERARIAVAATAGLAFAALAMAVFLPATLERLTSFSGAEADTGRSDLWTVAWRVSEDHPIRGVGLESFRAAAANYVDEPGQITRLDLVVELPRVVHNVYLQQLAETGVIGLGLLLAVLGVLLAASLRAARLFEAAGEITMARLSRSAFVAQTAVLASVVFISAGSDERMWALLGVGPMMLAVARRATGAEVAT